MIDELFLQVIGAVFLLLYGVRLTGQGFELAFGARIRGAFSAPGGRLGALGAGALGTILLQSSGAVVTLLVSFVKISPLPLASSLVVILGADLGSTLTIQILSFRIYQYALPVLSVGVALNLFSRKGMLRAAGQGILGFGFLLLALSLLSNAASGMGKVESLRSVVHDLGNAPLVAFAWGVGLAALFQSGTAVMILLIAFTQQGLLAPPGVLPFVLGANVGGVSVAFVAASGLAASGKRIAWGHMLMKTAGALLFLPFHSLVGDFFSSQAANPSRIVANVHTIFNLTLAVVFLPLAPRIAEALVRWLPERRSSAPRWKPVYLDPAHLPVTGAALGQTARELLRMADMVQEMHDLAVRALHENGEELADRIARMDDDVDALTREIKVFLSQLGEGALDAEQTRASVAYISIVSDLENIGDLIDKTLGDHVRRMARAGQRFSEEGEKELSAYLRDVGSMYREAVSAFVTRDRKAAENVIGRKKQVAQAERELRLAHIRRLRKATPESLESSAAHIDIIASWKVIASHCASIAYNILQMTEE